jgi:preprotein translocase subunit SecF
MKNPIFNFLKSLIFGLGLYCLLTIPHFIFLYTFGESGIQYPIELIFFIGLISGFFSSTLSKIFS